MNDQMLLEMVRRADPVAAGIGDPPPALLERVLASPRAEETPRRHLRRSAKFALVAAAFGVSAAIASLAIAGTGWLTGEPAPPPVVTNFQSYTPQLGFHPDPGSAVLVARDDQVRLYATTNREGTYCLDVTSPWKPATTRDGGTCVPQATASAKFIAGIASGGPLTGQGLPLVVAGRIVDPAARSVQFTLPDGDTLTRPLGSSGFFVASVTVPALCANDGWRTTFTALDADGDAVARTATLSLMTAMEKNSPLRGPVHSCLLSWLRP